MRGSPNPPAQCRYGHSQLGFRLDMDGDKRKWRCRECQAARKPRDLEARRARHRIAQREWSKRNLEKVRAHHVVNNEVKAGRLVRPDRCAQCQRIGKVQASHHDYAKPLDIEWLCTMCHAAKDAAMRREAA